MELQPESSSQPAIVPTQFILHSIAAPWGPERIYEYWRDSTNLESHFGLGVDGSMGQFLSTETCADANYKANRRPDGTGAVSMETYSDLQHTDPWTEEQIRAIIRVGVWLHRTHRIPLRICRTASDSGFGYHRMFREWSTGGTECPGDARVAQFHSRVFPGIVAAANEEDPMAAFTEADLTRIVQNAVGSMKSDITHDILYWLNQAMSEVPESAGDHPLRFVVPELHAKFAAMPQELRDALAGVLKLHVSLEAGGQ